MSAWLGLGGSKTNKPIIYSGLNVSSSQMDMALPIFWGQRRLATLALWYNDFQKHAQSAKGKGGGIKGGKQYTYSAAVILAMCEGEVDSIVNVWTAGSTTTTTTLAALNMTFFSGSAAQLPWSFVTTKYPVEARAYALTAYLASPKMDLGQSASVPDNAFESVRAAGFAYTPSSDGWIDPTTHVATSAIDCLMSDIIPDFLTNVQYGMGFDVADMGSIAQYAAYQRAQGFFFSPYLKTQEKATSIIDRWAQLSNSWIYWSGTQLQFVPLGDAAVTGNGATYTPDNAAAYDLTLADLLGAEPVRTNRVDPADCYNRTVVQITDRTIGYISNPIEYKDQTLIDLYGPRDASSTQADEVCRPDVGRLIAQLLGKRAAYLRNSYSFKTSYRFVRCLPGTVLTLTTKRLDGIRVRVREVEEDENGDLSFTAEEFPGTIGTFTGATQSSTAVPPNTPDQNALPGSVNTPAVVEPDSAFTGGTSRLVVSASGGAAWGGAHVNISFDGTAYQDIGTISSPAVQGLLTAPLPSHVDPDTVDTLSVDTSESLSAPQPVTNDDADALRTLSYVSAQPTLVSGTMVLDAAGELLAFGDVASTGTYAADLTYLRRGQYGTSPAAWSTGDQFTVVDVLGSSGTSVSYELPSQYIGTTIYIKVQSFNVFERSLQDLSTCVEYSYTPTGRGYGGGAGGVPLTPTGLAATAGVGQLVFSWAANAATDNVSMYTLYMAPGSGGSFGSASAVWKGSTLSVGLTGLPAGTNTYFLTASNAVGEGLPTLGINATVSTPLASALTVKDHGATLTSAATSLDFQGGGVSLSAVGPAVTVTITGGGSSVGGVLPLVTGDLPGPVFITDDKGQTIGVPL